jgi:hypothetical protein
METKFYPQREMIFTKHPVFDNVKAAMFITSKEANMACVCLIEIAQTKFSHLSISLPSHSEPVKLLACVEHRNRALTAFCASQPAAGVKGNSSQVLRHHFLTNKNGTQIKIFFPWRLDS